MKVSVPPPAPALAPAQAVTGTQLAMAFEGTLERRSVPFGYRLGLLFVAVLVVLLPVVYFGVIVAAAWLTYEYAINCVGMVTSIPSGRAVIVMGIIYVAPIVAGGLLVLAMILPLFWRPKRRPKQFWVDRREQPLLFAYVDKLCDVMHTPRPQRIAIAAEPNAAAVLDNGLFGLVSRRLVLTLGLPLAATMDLREFTGVIAHELGHFSQGSSMRLSYLVHRINAWFARMAWRRTSIDGVLDGAVNNGGHWMPILIGVITKMVIGIARLAMKGMAIVSHALTMNLSRQAEFDADSHAARIVGSEAAGKALQDLPTLDAAFRLAITKAKLGWQKRQLPDDLVLATKLLKGHLPPDVKQKLDAAILTSKTSWFDTHPPLFKRVGALKKANLKGVLKLDAPATVLFKDYDELCKMATIDLYQMILGKHLQPEHLVPTKIADPAAVKKSGALPRS